MKTKLHAILTLIMAFVVQFSFAQEKTIKGTITDESGLPMPGVNIIVKGTGTGTQTDFDGNYSITAAAGDALSYSFVGYTTKEAKVGSSNTININLVPDVSALDEVVVTALGIKREKKALGYSTTNVGGSEVSTAKETNFINSLSGKVAGLDIKKSNTLGGSSNIILRGYTSITGNNQPLFVVDGTPISNNNSNTTDQTTGRGGYDYGNAAADINPDDVESINVLKGAAASNLYGSRAANGVIIITTKKGKTKQGIGVTVNSGFTIAQYDKDTFPTYQNEYGAGYGPYYGSTGYFFDQDIDGDGIDDLTTPFTEDASFGGAFDPNLLVYQWDAFYPESPNYLKKTPYVVGANGPNSVFQTGTTLTNSVSLSGGTETSTFRLGYSKLDQTGILPNSKIKRNSIDFNGSHNFTDKFKASVKSTFTKTDGKGRYGTGYDAGNIMQSFRQWNQRNVDYDAQKNAYLATGRNISWNYSGNPLTESGLKPIFFDNPYWVLFENFETDTRNRLFGNVALSYELTEWLTVTGRTSLDTYNELQEERIAVGSKDVSQYSKFERSFSEINYDLLFNYDFDLSEKLTLNGVAGATARTEDVRSTRNITSGGLVVPRLYALSNSINLLPPAAEYEGNRKDYGFYGNASFGYDNTVYIDLSGRYDISSTLPAGSNGFFYPAISTSIIFSKFIDQDWLSFGKIRANYAEVGNSTDPYRIIDSYSSPTNFTVPLFSVNSQKNNRTLVNELTKGLEFGLEMAFANRRAGFDLGYYSTKTEDQIFPVRVSSATGFRSKVVNSGRVDNKGIEASLFVSPIRNDNFEWRVNATWAKNTSEVIELFDGVDNLQIASLQGGVSINATVGQPYGTIKGTNFLYLNGQPVINQTNGRYEKDPNTESVIGNINPDWKGGITNTLTYKNLTFSFLIDIQKGGDLFSLDTWYGFATGVYDITAGLNELGNPKRLPIADGGGIILDGVAPDGSANTTRTSMENFANALGYVRAPNALHVYDASYVKLREATLSYKFPKKLLSQLPFTNITLTAVGRNLWIIDKNIPYTDPEAGLSSGNVQGYQSGAHASQKEYGFNLKFEF